MNWRDTTMCVAILGTVAGCASLKGSILPYEPKDIAAAKDRGDMALLKKICDGDARVRYDSSKSDACAAVNRAEGLSGKSVDGGSTAGVKGSCDTLLKRYEDTSQDWETHRAFADQFVECNFYKELFEKVVHWGNREEGVRLLIELEDAGSPVVEEFVKYAKENKGAKFIPGSATTTKFALDNIGKWLIKKGHKEHCQLFADAAADASEAARVWVMPYFKKAKCKEGKAIAVELLLSESAKHRKWACNTLAVIGDPRVIRKLAVLAQTDSHSQVREEERNGRIWAVKEWPVREACKAAIGKIKLRH